MSEEKVQVFNAELMLNELADIRTLARELLQELVNGPGHTDGPCHKCDLIKRAEGYLS